MTAATFLLILTILGGGERPAITSVGPFYTQEACISAANQWLAQMRKSAPDYVIARASCSPQK